MKITGQMYLINHNHNVNKRKIKLEVGALGVLLIFISIKQMKDIKLRSSFP